MEGMDVIGGRDELNGGMDRQHGIRGRKNEVKEERKSLIRKD